jgi:Tfp pilus assembly protein FimV
MKIYFSKRVRWWAPVLAVLMICTGCAHKAQKPETKPPESREPAPSKPGTVSTEPTPPQREPARAPTSPLPTPPGEPMHKESYYTHTVKWSGETLFIIAAWYTGDRENWKALAEAMIQANPNTNIHRIFVGDKILVPESLLKTRDLMPKEFVDNFYQKPKTEKVPPKPAPSQTEEEEPKLFGPKELPKR